MKKIFYKKLTLTFITSLIFCFYSTNVFAQEYDFSKYKNITPLLKGKKFAEAGKNLLNMSAEQLKEEKKLKSDISPSLLTLILAGICFEKSRDIITYDIWNIINKGYSKTSTSWENEREQLSQKILDLSNIREKTSNDSILIDLENYLQITSYSGPYPSDYQKAQSRQE